MLYYYPKLIQNKSRRGTRWRCHSYITPVVCICTCIYSRSKFTLYYTRLKYPIPFPL